MILFRTRCLFDVCKEISFHIQMERILNSVAIHQTQEMEEGIKSMKSVSMMDGNMDGNRYDGAK